MRTEPISLGEALASAFDNMIAEARAECAEHEEHVADCQRRLQNLEALRAVMAAFRQMEPAE